MKKGLLLIVVMVAAIAVKAQDIYVGGSFNVWRNSTGNTTSFKVAPEIGYNFNETWALGADCQGQISELPWERLDQMQRLRRQMLS